MWSGSHYQRTNSAHASDNRVEMDRARLALNLAAEGRTVAVVSGGDPGVFAMAAAVFEAVEDNPKWLTLDIQVAPGVTAMQAAAARLGAPLGHDFCAISLSDNLKPWAIVERRLRAACEGDFVIALYNPASKARPTRIVEAFDLMRQVKASMTPVAFARAVGRADETLISRRWAKPMRASSTCRRWSSSAQARRASSRATARNPGC